MTVEELIIHLQKFPPDMPVAIRMYSEQCLLEAKEITIEGHCEARKDGWIQNKRPDKPVEYYLMFPGN